MKIATSNVPHDLLDVTRIAVKFYVDRYFTKRMKDRTDIIKIAFRVVSGDNIAFASYEPDEPRLPTEFLIEFNEMYRDIPVRDYLITLFHEMTHIKQYCNGDMKHRHLYTLWKGVKTNDSMDTYWDHPWEREALAIELGAYSLFSDAFPELDLKRWKPTYLGRSGTTWIGLPQKPK